MARLSKLPRKPLIAASLVAALTVALSTAPPAGAARRAERGRAVAAPGFSLSVVHEFPAALAGTPKSLGLRRDGNFYGATSAIGTTNGTVFRFSRASVYTTIATLDYATQGGPSSAPILGQDGSLYGLTFDGGPGGIGSVYKITLGGTFTTLISFNGVTGMYPTSLVQGPHGDLYGTTYYGGSHGDGNAYRLTTSGKFTNLVSCKLHGCLYPVGLAIGRHGNVYGFSEGDKRGFGNSGQVFAITPKFRTEVNFNSTAADDPLNLELGGGYSLYGLTEDFYTGTQHFFRLTPPGKLKFLGTYHFPGAGAFGPQVRAGNGDFYGTLMGDVNHPGWIYQLTPSGAFRIVATFSLKNGVAPDELTLGADGALYGTTQDGGSMGGGVIFKLTLPR
jgi:uncharacterized repeat protein (TIGR03803 family)